MKILKHTKASKYIFIHTSNDYLEAYTIAKGRKQIKYELIELGKTKKKVDKFLEKYKAKNYEEIEPSTELAQKVEHFLSTFEVNKKYFFIVKNNKEKIKSKLTAFELMKRTDAFVIHHFDEEEGFSTIQNYIEGHVPTAHQEILLRNTSMTLSFFLSILFTLDFEVIDDKGIVEFLVGKPFDNKKKADDEFFRKWESPYSSFDTEYMKVQYFSTHWSIKVQIFKIKNDKIKSIQTSHNLHTSLDTYDEALPRIKKFYAENEYIKEEITQAIFDKKYTLDLVPKKIFSAPVKRPAKILPLPLSVPHHATPVDELKNSLMELNKIYFYVNKAEGNPLDWKCSFIVVTNFEDNIYLSPKVFSLRDFNKIYRTELANKLNYNSDVDDFFKKKIKQFKKAKLKPIATEAIFKILTEKTTKQLQAQKQLNFFVIKDEFFSQVFEVYKNYVNIRILGDKKQYFQFFKTAEERETYLAKFQTDNTSLYAQEIDAMNDFAIKVKVYDASFLLKQNLVENPILQKELSGYAGKKFNQIIFEEDKKEWHFKSNYTIASKKSLYISGNLIVDGTLFLTRPEGASYSDNVFIFIEGNLKAKNIIVDKGFQLFYVGGNIEIGNLAVCCYQKNRTFLFGGKCTSDILLHNKNNPLDIKSPFKYNKELTMLSSAVLDKSIFQKVESTYRSGFEFIYPKIYELLAVNKKIIADNLEVTEVDTDEYYQLQFENTMRNWGYYYSELAGCKVLSIGEDNEVKGSSIHPSGGDWIVHDTRGKSGTYGYDHECAEICKVKIKRPKNHGVNYKEKPLKLKVDAMTLMYRYQWVAMHFINWAHRLEVSPYASWKTLEDLNKDYESEKTTFVDDPHLALYWLIHFGLSLDKRYEEIKKIVLDHKLNEKLEELNMPIGFFNNTNAFYDLKITNSSNDDSEFENIFLKRRAYLLWLAHSYQYRGGENALQEWWWSIVIYPKAEQYMIKRMRWFCNNLKKFDQWNAFDKLIKKEKSKEISLLSFVLANNPNTKNKTKHAHQFLEELKEHQQIWKGKFQRSFAQAMIWDLREHINDKALLKEVMAFYFEGDTASEKYEDLAKVLGEANDNLGEVRTIVAQIEERFKLFSDQQPDRKKEADYKKETAFLETIDTDFEKLDAETLFQVIENLQSYKLLTRAFRFLFLQDIPNKEKIITPLIARLGLSSHDIPNIFKGIFPKLIKDENDPNLAIVKSWLVLPQTAFANEYAAKGARGASCMFLLDVLHLPKIFEHIDQLLKNPIIYNTPELADTIFTKLWSKEYNTKINPTNRFSKKQIETMLISTVAFIGENHAKLTHDSMEAVRTIYYCENPLAKDWLTKNLDNKELFKNIQGKMIGFEQVSAEVKGAITSALEFVRDREQYHYLEYKDEKSNKFWEIEFYGNSFVVRYGKIGTEGTKKSKEFKDIEMTHKEGAKLVAQKMKKGYVKIIL